MAEYTYGEEVDYEFNLLEASDKDKLINFSCGNVKLDKFIQEEIIPQDEVINEDGLIFKVEDKKIIRLSQLFLWLLMELFLSKQII